MERRLAAILAADVVGYTRLMGADEADRLAAIRTFREGPSAPFDQQALQRRCEDCPTLQAVNPMEWA